MAKVRVVMAEMEGSDASVIEAIRSFVGAAAPQSMVAIGPVLETPEVEAPKVPELPAAAVEAEAPKAAVARKPREEKPAAVKAAATEEKGGCRGMVYGLLKAGAKTSAELVKAVESRYTAGSVYLALKELRAAMVVETRADPRDGEVRNFRMA